MRKDKHFKQLIQIYFKALLTALFILFYGISIHSVQSYTTWGSEGSPRINDDDVKNTIFSGRKEKPEIEVIQPSLLYVYDGEETDFRITLQNKSKEKTYRINILEDKGRNPNTPLIFYSPPKKIVLEPGRSITVNCRVSVVLKQKNPVEMQSTLYLKIETAIGAQIPIEIPINLFVPSFKIIKAILKNKENPIVIVTIRNIGRQDLMNQIEFHTKIGSQSLNIIKKKNIKALETFKLTFTLPDMPEIDKNLLLRLKIITTTQPIHIWELPGHLIEFVDESNWFPYIFVTSLFLISIFVIIYTSKNPEKPVNIMELPLQGLESFKNRLKSDQELETILYRSSVQKYRFEKAVSFSNDWDKKDQCKYLVELIEANCEALTGNNIHLYTLAMGHDFMLNMAQCLLAFPPGDMPANEVIGHIKKIEGYSYQVCLFITFNESQQAELRRTSLNLDNLFVTPQSKELTHLLLSPSPLDVFAKLIASQVKVTRISPYQTKGGVKKESVFFGRVQLLTHIMQREPANYLLVGGRQLGKSSILKAIDRRYSDDPNIECHYLHLQSSEITGLLAGSLDLQGDTNLQELLKHLRQSPGGKYRLFLIDEADQFIASESQTGCIILQHFRGLSEEGQCYFIFAGFWNLYHASTFEYQSPIKNFGETLTIEALEPDACRQLATKPMSVLNIHYESDELVEILLQETGQRPNLIAIICNEILKNLDMTQRVIRDEHLQEVMDSNEVRSSLSGWEELTLDETSNRLDRIIVYATINEETFTQTRIMQILDGNGCSCDPEAVKQSLARLELAFILKRQKQSYFYCVPLFKKMVQQQDPEYLLNRELKSLKGQ